MYRILELNPQLKDFARDIDLRMSLYHAAKQRILQPGQTLNDFANAHQYYGFHHVDGGWYYREWAPSAYQLYLKGEFNQWNPTSHPLKKLGNGDWELYLEGDDALWNGCKVKTVVDVNMTRTEHIPLYVRRAVQDKRTNGFDDQRMGDMRCMSEQYQACAFYRNGLLFVFNFHHSNSLKTMRISVPNPGAYTVALSSDDKKYGGFDNVEVKTYTTKTEKKQHFIEVYAPARTCFVLKETVIKPPKNKSKAK